MLCKYALSYGCRGFRHWAMVLVPTVKARQMRLVHDALKTLIRHPPHTRPRRPGLRRQTELSSRAAAPCPSPPLPRSRQMLARVQGRQWWGLLLQLRAQQRFRASPRWPVATSLSRWLDLAVLGMEAAGSSGALASALPQPRRPRVGSLPQRPDPLVSGPDPHVTGPRDDGRWVRGEMACGGCAMLAQGAVACGASDGDGVRHATAGWEFVSRPLARRPQGTLRAGDSNKREKKAGIDRIDTLLGP
jgi:hypothetical protein